MVLNKILVVSVLILISVVAGALFFVNTQQKNMPSGISDLEPQSGIVKVVLTDTGYVPSQLLIFKGTTVVFSTERNKQHWPASNLHPTHAIYAAFDPKRPLDSNETWGFTFDQVGTWNFHDHLRSYFQGSIEVIE